MKRHTLSFFLIVSMSIAATALGADKKAQFHVGATSLPVYGSGVWSAQGPAPIQYGQCEGITQGTSPAIVNPEVGAIKAAVAHPTDPNTLWVGTVNGGIWKTTTATSNPPVWVQQTDTQPSLTISAMKLDPTDLTYNTLVAATTARYSSFYGYGGPSGKLYRTTNGGANWSLLQPTTLAGRQISAVAPLGQTIFVTLADSCSDWPVYESTDGGASFFPIMMGSLPHGFAYDLVSDPNNNAVLYAAVQACGGASGIYKTINSGASWSLVSDSTINALFASISNAKIAVGKTTSEVYVATANGDLTGLFRSGNGGASWVQLDKPTTTENGHVFGINPGNQSYIHFSLAADPSNQYLVYIGGDRQPNNALLVPYPWPNSLGAYDYSGRIFRVNAAAPTGSQATSLTHCTSGTAACNFTVSTIHNSSPHADSRSLTVNASGDLVETDDGGIYRRTSPTGTGDWFSLIGNLQLTEMHDVVWDHVSHMILSGNQDNGNSEQTTVGGTLWNVVTGGDGGNVAADDLTSSTQSTRYTSYIGDALGLHDFLRRTMNTSGQATYGIYPGLTVIGGANMQGQFVTPFELNLNDARRMLFAGSNDLYESFDRGDTIAGLGLNRAVTAAVYGGRWSSGADNPDVIWAISGSSVYERTSGGGAPILTSSQPTTFGLVDIAANPNNWWNAYVVNVLGQVFATSDAGATWTNVTGNLPSGTTDVRTIVFISSSPNAIAVGGLNGVFRMDVGNPGVWNQYGSGLPNTIVYDLEYDPLDDTLVAGTLGRGAWKLGAAAVTGTLPSLSINDVSVTEGNGGSNWATFTVSLSAPVGYTVGVNYATSDGTATGQSTTSSNISYIAINDNAAASPYPSSISVSGVADPIGKVTVTLSNFTHTFPADVDVLLVGPGGQKVLLMSDCGGSNDAKVLSFTFDDAAPGPLPQTSPLQSGTYRPTDYETGDSFPSPAPVGPYGTSLSVFNGTSANGTWSLYVVDDAGADIGYFQGGWSITFSSGDYAPTSGPLIFQPGTISKNLSIPVFPDTTPEANEVFYVSLSSPSNATIADSLGMATIIDDDSTIAAPTNVVATATATNNVNVTWNAVSGASSYRVFRSSGGGIYIQVGVASASPFNDGTVSANTAYLYRVRAVSSGGTESADSNKDLATTVMFTDPVLTAGTTGVQGVHFTQLLTAVNAVRALAGLSSIAFTTPSPATGFNVLGAHIGDLRNGLDPARSALGLSAQSYTDPTIMAGSTSIKAAHVSELRTGVQ